MNVHVLSAFRNVLHAGRACPWHAHDGVEIVFHAEGAGWTATPDGNRWNFEAGDLTVYPARLRHIQHMIRPGLDACLVLNCRGASWPRLLHSVQHLHGLADDRLQRELLALTESVQTCDPLERFERDCRAAVLFCQILKRVANVGNPHRGPAPCRVDSACRLVAQSLDRMRRPHDVARALGVSEGHLRHLFRAKRGVSLQEWMTTTRIERAAELLRHSPLPIKAIAYDCGFQTARYFSTAFRKAYGCPPQAYRHKEARRVART